MIKTCLIKWSMGHAFSNRFMDMISAGRYPFAAAIDDANLGLPLFIKCIFGHKNSGLSVFADFARCFSFLRRVQPLQCILHICKLI